MNVVIFSLAMSVSASAGSLPANGHQVHSGLSMASGRVLAPRAFYYTGYRPGEVRASRPMIMAPEGRQNQAGIAQDPGHNLAKERAQHSEPLNGANVSAASQSLSAAQVTAHRSISLPSGIKPSVTTPAERSQAATNLNQKFQQAENKMANQLWRTPDSRTNRRNRLEQSRAYFVGLIDWGYPLSLLDTWCDDLLDDQVDIGMPNDLIDSYWGQPVSTQDYEEYYSPYEACTYLTPDGNYRQVIYQNGVVAQAM